MNKKRMAIFVSGSGTNCENIIQHFANHDNVEVALVWSNRADAYALKRAEKYSIPTIVMGRKDFNDANKVLPVLEEYRIDFIVLAGFLLMIPNFLVQAYDHRMVNLHPALLPKYVGKGMYGHHVHEAVVAAHEKETGITIHIVDNHYDRGTTLFQARCAVDPDDTPDTVAAKIHLLEKEHFPRVIDETIHR